MAAPEVQEHKSALPDLASPDAWRETFVTSMDRDKFPASEVGSPHLSASQGRSLHLLVLLANRRSLASTLSTPAGITSRSDVLW